MDTLPEDDLSKRELHLLVNEVIVSSLKIKDIQCLVKDIHTTSGARNLSDIGMWNLTVEIGYTDKLTTILRRYYTPTYRTITGVTQAVLTCISGDIDVIRKMFEVLP